MPPQLQVIQIRLFSGNPENTGVQTGQTFDLVKDRVLFGRSPENDIPLFSHCKARCHGQLLKEGGDYYVEDFAYARAPTLVNDAPIAGRTLLNDGDVISVDWVKFVYRVDDKVEPTPPSP
jgi:pSer/pThr/pTyr-binding forkhead associated (FHA) protein